MRADSSERGGEGKASRGVVGREREIEATVAALVDGERVVTLVGSGGVGKTVLALRVLAALEARDDVGFTAFVACAESGSAASLADAIAEALGLSLEPARGTRDRLGRALAARGPGVLVLDGIEPSAALGLASSPWLASAPEISLLITSRAPTGLPAERIHELGPLGLPTALEDPLSSAAVRAFVLAAERARPGYTPAPSELPFVVEIVTLLEGHPLALELAAARLAVMGERALLHRLRQSLAASGPAAASPLGAAAITTALAGSWAALAPPERTVLAACAVFRGGFTLEAAEAVASAEAGDVLDVLQSLRRQSLVRAWPAPEGSGDLRLSLFPLVRAFAQARLVEAGQTALVEARHAAFYAAGPPAPRTSRSLHAFATAERENLLAVVERVIAAPLVTARTAEPALRALCLLGPLARAGGRASATLALLAPALRATQGSGADPRLRAEVLALRAETSRRAGQLPSAARDLLEAAAIARAMDDAALMAKIDNQLAFLGASRGELALALEHHERAARAFAALGQRDGEGDALRGLGVVAARRGDRRAARACFERAIAAHALAHDEAALAEDHLVCGALLLDEGEAEARAAFVASARHAERAGDGALASLARAGLGQLAHDAGDLDAARAAYAQAALDLEALGQPQMGAVFVGLAGIVARERRRPGEAYAQLTAALDVLGSDGERLLGLIVRGHLAALEAASERRAEARAIWAPIAAATEPETEPALAAALAVLAAQAGMSDAIGALAEARSFHARVALRCSDPSATDARSPSPLPLPPEALLLGPAASWFRPPRGERVSLERRRPMALLLDALVSARLTTPGRAVSSDELLAAAWPGERIIASAGVHRVRVAIASLRKLGLRDLVQTIEPGYRLTSDVVAIRLG